MKQLRINLATFEYFNRRLSMIMMAAALFLIFIVSAANIYLYSDTKKNIDEYDLKITRIKKIISQKKSRQKEQQKNVKKEDIDRVVKQVAAVNTLIAMDMFPWNRFIDLLERKIPEGLFLESFSPSDNYDKLIITGWAESAHKITFFLRRLEEWELIQTTILQNLGMRPTELGGGTPSEKEGISFTIENTLSIDKLFKQGDPKMLGETLVRLSKRK